MLDKDDLQALTGPFAAVVGAKAVRPFGPASPGFVGISDGAEGVQWNLNVERASGAAHLGVNLEGMRYGGRWPVARLILAELREPRLPAIAARLPQRAAITLLWMRDAWQVTARPVIVEALIAPTPMALDRLTDSAWRDALQEAKGCLEIRAGHVGRSRQTVTRAKTGARVSLEVSPHLAFWWRLPRLVLRDQSALRDALRAGRDALQALHDFVASRSA